jgi:hypothetical protein
MVRFNALEILVTPIRFFARDFSARTSDEVQARRAIFFFFIPAPILGSRAFIMVDSDWQVKLSKDALMKNRLS